MSKPIIDALLLSDEQQAVIREYYGRQRAARVLSARAQGRYEAIMWLFGKGFFEK